jgi:hypothetical protein
VEAPWNLVPARSCHLVRLGEAPLAGSGVADSGISLRHLHLQALEVTVVVEHLAI